jgi:hypothetical protein
MYIAAFLDARAADGRLQGTVHRLREGSYMQRDLLLRLSGAVAKELQPAPQNGLGRLHASLPNRLRVMAMPGLLMQTDGEKAKKTLVE